MFGAPWPGLGMACHRAESIALPNHIASLFLGQGIPSLPQSASGSSQQAKESTSEATRRQLRTPPQAEVMDFWNAMQRSRSALIRSAGPPRIELPFNSARLPQRPQHISSAENVDQGAREFSC